MRKHATYQEQDQLKWYPWEMSGYCREFDGFALGNMSCGRRGIDVCFARIPSRPFVDVLLVGGPFLFCRLSSQLESQSAPTSKPLNKPVGKLIGCGPSAHLPTRQHRVTSQWGISRLNLQLVLFKLTLGPVLSMHSACCQEINHPRVYKIGGREGLGRLAAA